MKVDTASVDTQTGVLKGKFGYMSPEQTRGHAVDRRSDVYALGIMLYELTLGRRAFTGLNAFEIMNKVLHGEFTPPRSIDPEYPVELDAIVLCAMGLQPDDRFATAAELADAIEAFARDRGIVLGAAPLIALMEGLFGQPEDPKIAFDPEPVLSERVLPETVALEPAPASMRGRIAGVAVAAALVAGGLGWWLGAGRSQASTPVPAQEDAIGAARSQIEDAAPERDAASRAAWPSGCCTPHGWNTHASVDQVVAEAVGQTTAFKSLELGIRSGGQHPGSRISYAAPAQPLSPERDPRAVFDRLFGDWSGDPQQAARLKAERLDILDAVKPELDTLMGKVGRDDEVKIQAHLEAVSALQHRLQLQHECTVPEAPPAIEPNVQANLPDISRLQIDLLVEALACGLTNVGSLMYRVGENDNDPYPWLGISSGHHELSHAGNSDVAARDALTSIYRWYAGEFAYLVERMASIIEADGSRLLDNTLVVWGSEIAIGNTHAWGPMPFVLAGSCGKAIRTGRFVTHDGENHCRLLTTICNAMGLHDESFGNLDDGSGPLASLLG